MEIGDDDSPKLLAWRVASLEAIERSQNQELHELRHQVPDLLLRSLREDYYSKAETMNLFVPRSEVKEQRAIRREWPQVVSSVAVAVIGLIEVVVLLTGHH